LPIEDLLSRVNADSPSFLSCAPFCAIGWGFPGWGLSLGRPVPRPPFTPFFSRHVCFFGPGTPSDFFPVIFQRPFRFMDAFDLLFFFLWRRGIFLQIVSTFFSSGAVPGPMIRESVAFGKNLFFCIFHRTGLRMAGKWVGRVPFHPCGRCPPVLRCEVQADAWGAASPLLLCSGHGTSIDSLIDSTGAGKVETLYPIRGQPLFPVARKFFPGALSQMT